MTYSFTTHTKQGEYYFIVFTCDTEDTRIIIKFLPTVPLPFSRPHIDLSSMRMRNLHMILNSLENYGFTLITEGLQ